MDISLQFGPILIGVLFGMILHGVLLTQMYHYYIRYKDTDTAVTKYLVLYVLVVETVNAGFSIYMVYAPLVLQFGDPEALQNFPLALVSEPALMVAISAPIQLFIARRIVRLQHSRWIGGIISVLSAVSFAGGVLASYQIKHYDKFARKRKMDMAVSLWLISAAAADILIAGSLAWSLCKRKTGLQSTDAVLSKIIMFTVQTGLVTSVAAILNVITLGALPIGNSTNFIFNISLMKIYGNFLLANLNSRASWTGSLQQAANKSLSFPDPQPRVVTSPPLRFMVAHTLSSIGGVADTGYKNLELPKPALLQSSSTMIDAIGTQRTVSLV